MFAGPNGSGKSVLKSYLDPELLGVYLNADEIEEGGQTRQKAGSQEILRGPNGRGGFVFFQEIRLFAGAGIKQGHHSNVLLRRLAGLFWCEV